MGRALVKSTLGESTAAAGRCAAARPAPCLPPSAPVSALPAPLAPAGEGSEAACLAEAKRRHEKDVAKHGGLAAGVQAAMEAAVGAGAAAELPQGG